MRRRWLWIMTPLFLISVFIFSFPAFTSPSVYSISLDNFSPYYSPTLATVTAGQPIQWINETASKHTITHYGCVGKGPCAFDSGPLNSDASFSIYDLQPGLYPYHCRLHPIMRGALIVLDPVQETSSAKIFSNTGLAIQERGLE